MRYLFIASLIFNLANAQQVDTNEISIVKKLQELDANQIYLRLNHVVNNVFKSADDIIQLNDPNLKKIVIRKN